MNPAQELWWKQSQADLGLFQHLRGAAGWPHQCHALQALQMAAEKISRASFRAGGTPPRKLSHLGLTMLLRRLGSVRNADQQRVARIFRVDHFKRFELLLKRVRGIALEIERLPPAIAGPDRVNTEYPWPNDQPAHAPAGYEFPV